MWLSILQIEKYVPTYKGMIQALMQALYRSIFTAPSYDIILLEYGIDHPWEMDFLLSITKPDIAILTKIDYVHKEYFWTQEMIAQEKYKLLLAAQKYIFCWDTKFLHIYKKDFSSPFFIFWNDGSDISYTILKLYEQDASFNVTCSFQIPSGTYTLSFPFLPLENILYIGIGLHILHILHIPFSWNNSFFSFSLQPSRFSLIPWKYGSICIDSSYNACPASMKLMIETTYFLQKTFLQEYACIFCLGDMREIWEDAWVFHEELWNLLKQEPYVFVVWENMKQFFLPICKQAIYFPTSHLLWTYVLQFLKQHKEKKFLILFKWSQNTIFLEEALLQVIDTSKNISICRQDFFWKKKKEEFFAKQAPYVCVLKNSMHM